MRRYAVLAPDLLRWKNYVCTAAVVTISMLEDDLISHHLINWNSQLCLSKLQGVSVMGELLRLTNYDGMKLRKILLIIITAIILFNFRVRWIYLP